MDIFKGLPKDSVVDVFLPFLKFGSYVGGFPFEMDVKRGRTTIRPVFFVWSWLIMLAFMSSVAIALIDSENISVKYALSDFTAAIDKARFAFFGSMIVVTGLASYHKYGLYAKVLQLLVKTDERLLELGAKKDYKKLAGAGVRTGVAYLVANVIYLAFNFVLAAYWDMEAPVVLMVPTYFPGLYLSIVVFILSSLTHLLHLNVDVVADLLRKLHLERKHRSLNGSMWISDVGHLSRAKAAPGRKSSSLQPAEHALAIAKIEKIWIVYDTICDNMELVNESCSLVHLIVMLTAFIGTAFNEFYMLVCIRIVLQIRNYKAIAFLLFVVQQAVQYFTIMLLIVLACNRWEKSKEKLSTVLNRFLIDETNLKVAEKLHVFSTCVLSRSPSVTAFGLFKIDNSYMFTVIGASFTYIIILIQFAMQTMANDERYKKYLNGENEL